MPWISSISFYDGIIVIKKYKEKKLAPDKRVVVGTKQPVTPTIDVARKNGYYIK